MRCDRFTISLNDSSVDLIFLAWLAGVSCMERALFNLIEVHQHLAVSGYWRPAQRSLGTVIRLQSLLADSGVITPGWAFAEICPEAIKLASDWARHATCLSRIWKGKVRCSPINNISILKFKIVKDIQAITLKLKHCSLNQNLKRWNWRTNFNVSDPPINPSPKPTREQQNRT